MDVLVRVPFSLSAKYIHREMARYVQGKAITNVGERGAQQNQHTCKVKCRVVELNAKRRKEKVSHACNIVRHKEFEKD